MAAHTIKLHILEDEGLRRLAALERRSPKEQAAKIIADELARRGLITVETKHHEGDADDRA